MLEMGGDRAVGGHHGPFVLKHFHIVGTQIDHRLYGEHHSRLESWVRSGSDVVRHLRFLMNVEADAVATVLAHHPVTAFLRVGIHRPGNVLDAVSRSRNFYSFVQRFLRHVQQRLHALMDRADGNGDRGVAVVPSVLYAAVEAQDVPVEKASRAWYAVDNFVVHRRAEGPGKAVVAEKRRSAAETRDVRSCLRVELAGGHAGGDQRAHVRKGVV